MKSLPRITLLCAALLTMAACSSNRVDPKDYSGFLKDYSRLQEAKSPSGDPVMRWIDPKVNVNQYSQVFIEPSQFYPKPQPTPVISAQTLQEITRYFNEALRREMGSVVPLAKGPGPGVIVVRPAITAVSTSNEGLKPYEVIPIALISAGVNTAMGHHGGLPIIAPQPRGGLHAGCFYRSEGVGSVASIARAVLFDAAG